MIKEITIRTVRETGPIGESIQKPETLMKIWRESVETASWFDSEREAFIVFCLDRKNRLKNWSLVSLGTVDASLVHPREVFRSICVELGKELDPSTMSQRAYRLACSSASAGVIVAHNHPSGDPTPSAEDIRVTKQLVSAGQVLGIPVLDHLVIGSEDILPPGYISLRDKGYLNFSP